MTQINRNKNIRKRWLIIGTTPINSFFHIKYCLYYRYLYIFYIEHQLLGGIKILIVNKQSISLIAPVVTVLFFQFTLCFLHLSNCAFIFHHSIGNTPRTPFPKNPWPGGQGSLFPNSSDPKKTPCTQICIPFCFALSLGSLPSPVLPWSQIQPIPVSGEGAREDAFLGLSLWN